MLDVNWEQQSSKSVKVLTVFPFAAWEDYICLG